MGVATTLTERPYHIAILDLIMKQHPGKNICSVSLYGWRAPDEESKLRGTADFWTEFPKFLGKHDSILANSSSGPFYLGAKVWLLSVSVLRVYRSRPLTRLNMKPSLPDVYAFTYINRFCHRKRSMNRDSPPKPFVIPIGISQLHR